MTGAVWAVSPVAAPPAATPQTTLPAGNLPSTTAPPASMVMPALGFLSLALWNGIRRRLA